MVSVTVSITLKSYPTELFPEVREHELVLGIDSTHASLELDRVVGNRLGNGNRDVFRATVGVLHRHRVWKVERLAKLFDADDGGLAGRLDARGDVQPRNHGLGDPPI